MVFPLKLNQEIEEEGNLPFREAGHVVEDVVGRQEFIEKGNPRVEEVADPVGFAVLCEGNAEKKEDHGPLASGVQSDEEIRREQAEADEERCEKKCDDEDVDG